MLTKGLGRGGTERLLAGAVRHMDPARFRAEIAYLLPWKDAFVGEIEADGTPVRCLDAPKPYSLAWARRLRQIVRDHDIGLVHTHMPLPAVVARLVLPPARRGGPVVVHTEHNMWGRYRLPTRWLNRLTYRRNAAVMAVSDGVAQSIRSSVPVEVVIHGIDSAAMHHGPEARARARAALGIAADAPVVGTVGNMTAKKDHATLLRAFAEVHAAHAGAKLLLVGIGPLEDELRALTASLGLADAVVFTGMREDVFELLPGFDLFVLSSRFEGLPIALLEAMASGVAPVSTRVGGIPEVLTDGEDGLLVDPGDAGALAAALTKLLADDQAREAMAAAARRRAADFDLSRAVRQIEGIYERSLRSTRSAGGSAAGVAPR